MRPIAGEAHWQLGKAETHGGCLKYMYTKTAEEFPSYTVKDAQRNITYACSAKNALLNRGGTSPATFAFGRNPRLPQALLNEPDQVGAIQEPSINAQVTTNEMQRVAHQKPFLDFQVE